MARAPGPLHPRVERELLSLSEEAVAQAFGDVILDPMLEEARQELQRLVEAEAAPASGGDEGAERPEPGLEPEKRAPTGKSEQEKGQR